tara:strand:+ start:94354 stop:95499 length:1146 start_codon:yes stop_codon:yes gene_type:complete
MISKRCKRGELNVAFISDIHVGHPRVPTVSVVDGLHKAFPDNKETSELDVIFIAGDFFDRNLYLSYDGIGEIQIFIRHLIRLCEKYNIVLRLLEGTPSHDWKQGCMFTQIHELLESKCDFRWIENLCIEYIESLDINVLYVPDEWEHDPNDTWSQVQGLLHDRGLEKVDFSVMHGLFEFQLPEHLNFSHHLSDRYLGITEHYVDIGHHHTQRSYKSKKYNSSVLVNGSFDRLCHGEEGAKGHYRVCIHADKPDDITFIENELATKFITISCLDMTLSDTMDVLKERVEKLPAHSHVRIIARAGSEVAAAKRDLELMWDHVKWTINREAAEDMVNDSKMELVTKYQTVDITKDSVKRLLEARLDHIDMPKREKMLGLLDGVL